MKDHTIGRQERAWPQPTAEHVLQLVQESSRELCEGGKRRAGRPCVVSGKHLCLAIMLCFLRGWNAQLDVWRMLTSERVGSFAPVQVTDQAIYNRIERASTALHWLFDEISAWLRPRVDRWHDRSLAPFASQVYATDVSLLDRMARSLPWLRTLADADPRLLAGQISALFDVRRQQWVRVDCWPHAHDNCKEHVQTLLERVEAGALVLFDRGYLSFPLFDALRARGIWWISRYANRVRYQVSHICYQADGVLDAVVFLGTGRSNQARYPVRLIQFWWQGRQYQYLTNVLDPHRLPLAEVVRLYARRWDIELAFRLLKDFLALHHLWSAKWAVVQAQVWCALILAQVYHALQVEIAGQAGVDVFEVSLDLLVRLTPGWLARGQIPLETAVRWGRELGLIRPSSRHRLWVPWVDPLWVIPPPASAIQPRHTVRQWSRSPSAAKRRLARKTPALANTPHLLE